MTKRKVRTGPVRFPVTTESGREGYGTIDQDGWLRVTATKGATGFAEAKLQGSAGAPGALAVVLLAGLPPAK
jgi:hypothetical protein